jgi:hypothetical protein
MTLHLFLLVLALVLAVLAAVKCPEPPHCAFGWASVALLILTLIVPGVR